MYGSFIPSGEMDSVVWLCRKRVGQGDQSPSKMTQWGSVCCSPQKSQALGSDSSGKERNDNLWSNYKREGDTEEGDGPGSMLDLTHFWVFLCFFFGFPFLMSFASNLPSSMFCTAWSLPAFLSFPISFLPLTFSRENWVLPCTMKLFYFLFELCCFSVSCLSPRENPEIIVLLTPCHFCFWLSQEI